MVENMIQEMEDYADENNVPIIAKDSLRYIKNYIKEHDIKRILEIGSAIGYSSIMMALTSDDITITTIERDEKRYLEALANIKKFNLEERITLMYNDALNVEIKEKYDLIFIDAAKAQNIKFFEKFEKNLSKNGTIITDNMNFHGLTENPEDIKSRNLRALVKKLNNYRTYLKENDRYETIILNIGDGIAISKPLI